MSDHLKRLRAPDSWHIAKKTNTFVTKTVPGPHNAMPCLSPCGSVIAWDLCGIRKRLDESLPRKTSSSTAVLRIQGWELVF
jgi:hypothetical protein